MPVTIVEVSVPEYSVAREPDYISVGAKVDRAIETNFPDGKYLLRAISLDEHPRMTTDELVRVILTTGTDKYDPGRPAVGQDEFSSYDYDIQASPIEIRGGRLVVCPKERFPTIVGATAWHFYHGARLDRGRAVRIDLLMLYDRKGLVPARKFHPRSRGVRRGLDRYLYKFKVAGNKRNALRGLVKLLR